MDRLSKWNKEYKYILTVKIQNDIEIYSTFNEEKAVMIERFNRTLKTMMYEQFTNQGNTVWYNILDDLIEKYNHTK